MDAWKNALFLQEKPMSIKFLVLGGGGILGFWGGSADFIFMGARIFRIFESRDNLGTTRRFTREKRLYLLCFEANT